MEGAHFQNYFLLVEFLCLLGGIQVGAIGGNITGFKGEAVNFTWSYTNHPVKRIYFGLWDKSIEVVEYSFLTVVVENNGSTTIHLNTREAKATAYLGRVEWVGNVSQTMASFQLSDISDYDDGKEFGMEVDFRDDNYDSEGNWTFLIVKPPSVFTYGPSLISAERGKQANFTWTYSLYDDDRQRLSSITFGVYKHGRFQVLCNAQVGKSSGCSFDRAHFKQLQPKSKVSFMLSPVHLSDEAVYEIRLGGTYRPLKNRAKLIVNDPPKIVSQPRSAVITENQKMNLTCTASGKPVPLITWFRNGQVVQSSKKRNHYIVYHTQREDAGTYKCAARNVVGEEKSSPVTIDVNYAPRINVSSDIITIHIPITKSEWLKCPTSARPTANIKWYWNGQPNPHSGENILVKITGVQDYKNYTCEATNLVGSVNVTFVLKQVGPPSIPSVACDKHGIINKRTYKLHWKVPMDDGGAPIQNYMVKYRTLNGPKDIGPWMNINVSSTETWYTLKVNWETTYEFTVTAWNKHGESQLDLRGSCVGKVGTDPSQRTTPFTTTKTIIAAAVKENTGGKSSLHVAVYIAPAIAVLAIIIVVIVIITLRRRSRNNQTKNNWTDQHLSFNALRDVFEPPTCNDKLLTRGQQTMVGSPSYQMDPNWLIPREKICILKVIGNGAFGLVYKGRVHGVGSDSVGWTMVAIKSPYADATESEVRDLMKEFELLKTLKPHPHVIKLLGCGEGDGRPLVIIEYVPFGDLLGYLRKSRGEEDDYYSDPEIKPNTNLSSQQLLKFGWNIADGMAYLASEKLIHRDLAARNVLVGEGLACKITDFGMAKDVSNDDIYVRTTEGRLPVKWTAIEALTGSGEYTTQSDVWSFGVVLYEICTIGSDPYPGITGREIPDQIERGYRMPRPKHVDTVLYEVMLSCWNKNPGERPTFPELKETLLKLEDAHSTEYINLSECFYQNITVSLPKEDGGQIRRTGSSKENDYHRGPHLSQSQIPVV